MNKLHGLIAAAFTPFKCGEVDVEGVPAYAQYLAANGVSGVFVNGTTGEGHSLTLEERIVLADAWLNSAPKGLQVIIHVGHNSLPNCCAMTRHAKENGADAVAAIGPSFFKPSLDELVRFTAEIADAGGSLPFYYYHIPSMTGLAFSMIDYLRAAETRIPNLAGVKFTYEDLMDYALCVNYSDQKFDMVFGRDEVLMCGISLGARAAIGSTYNFAAPLYSNIFAALANGDQKKALEYQLCSMALVSACIEASPRGLPAIRALTEWRSGINLGEMRAPISPVSQPALSRLIGEAERLAGALLSKRIAPHLPREVLVANGQLKEP